MGDVRRLPIVMSRPHTPKGPRTVRRLEITRESIELGRKLYPADEFADVDRPRTRGECADGERPCPFVSCVWHLAVHDKQNGSYDLAFPDRDVDEIPASCTLDIADRGGVTLQEVADAMNVSRQAIEQVERAALKKLVMLGWNGVRHMTDDETFREKHRKLSDAGRVTAANKKRRASSG